MASLLKYPSYVQYRSYSKTVQNISISQPKISKLYTVQKVQDGAGSSSMKLEVTVGQSICPFNVENYSCRVTEIL